MTKLRLSLILLAVASLAAAAPKPAPLTSLDEHRIAGALAQLDGYHQIVNNVDVVVPYKLSGKTRLAIARDILMLQQVNQAADNVKNQILKEFAPDGKGIPQTDPRTSQVLAKWNEVDSTPDPIQPALIKIPIADLGLDDPTANPIPGSVLAALNPILQQ